MKKEQQIAVLLTGGTIGSRSDGGVVDVERSAGYALIDRYEAEGYGECAQFALEEPYQTLSENITPELWLKLTASVQSKAAAGHKGIIVTHGSDTLPYTAAMLSYTVSHLALPIVMVAANFPLADERSNGLANFAAAVSFISGGAPPGVFVLFRSSDGRMPVYLGTRLFEAAPFHDQFASPYGIPFGWMEDGEFVREPSAINPSIEELRCPRAALWPVEKLAFSTGIVQVRPYPGLDYSLYRLDASRKPDAILHGVYHSATVSAAKSDNYAADFAGFAETCAAAGVDLFLAPMKESGTARYASSAKLEQLGIIGLEHMTVEAALVKLMLAYGMYPGMEKADERLTFLKQSIFYEQVKGGSWQ